MRGAAFFTLVGVLFLAHWLLSDPGSEGSVSQSEWGYAFGFIAAILAVVIASTGRGGNRLLALIPAGTLAAITFYVVAGGPLMLATWLAAAALALALPARLARRAVQAEPATL